MAGWKKNVCFIVYIYIDFFVGCSMSLFFELALDEHLMGGWCVTKSCEEREAKSQQEKAMGIIKQNMLWLVKEVKHPDIYFGRSKSSAKNLRVLWSNAYFVEGLMQKNVVDGMGNLESDISVNLTKKRKIEEVKKYDKLRNLHDITIPDLVYDYYNGGIDWKKTFTTLRDTLFPPKSEAGNN